MQLEKIYTIRNKNYRPHGTRSYVSALHRYKFNPTKPGPYKFINNELSKTDEKGDTGRVPAEDKQNDSLYLGPVKIGGQNLELDFDTGSADLWVSPKFVAANSPTWKELPGKSWQIQYGDGSTASGDCGTDELVLGGLVIKDQVIETAKELSSQFKDEEAGDGLLGLAYGKINQVMENGVPDPQKTPVENMVSQKDIPKDQELFTSALYSVRDTNLDTDDDDSKKNVNKNQKPQDSSRSEDSPKSFYTFGFIDDDLVKASGQDIHWTRIDSSQGFWQFPSVSCTIGDKKIDLQGNTAIADTGTTLALISDEVVDAFYKQIEGAHYDEANQGYIFPKNATVPDIRVAVGDKEFLIQKEDVAFANADSGGAADGGDPGDSHKKKDEGEFCFGGIQSRGELSFDIFGDTFLKSVYAIFDQGNNRFGVVPKIEKQQNMNPPDDDSGSGLKKWLCMS